jgi:hypothetical protein
LSNQQNISYFCIADGVESLKGMNCSDQVLYQVADIKANILSYVRIISDSASIEDQNADAHDHSDDEFSKFECGSSSGEEAEFGSDTYSFGQSSSSSEEAVFDFKKSTCSLSSGEEAEF